jgi:hypothetical protein
MCQVILGGVNLNKHIYHLDGNYWHLDGKYYHLDGHYCHLDGKYCHLDGNYYHLDGHFWHLDGDYLHVNGQFCCCWRHRQRYYANKCVSTTFNHSPIKPNNVSNRTRVRRK